MTRQVSLTVLALMASVTTLAATNSESPTDRDTVSNESGKELNMVEGIPMSEQEPGNQLQGQSEPGAAESVAGETDKKTPNLGLPVRPAGWAVYIDPAYRFRIGHPNGFVVCPQNVAKLAEFTPMPVASIFFMNPTMAGGALAGIEPPDLEVRVYQAGTVDSLKSWLILVGFSSANSGTIAQPYRNSGVSGLEVCQSTMISPGCSVYVLRSGRVYQLTPISRKGEAMIETFTLLP